MKNLVLFSIVMAATSTAIAAEEVTKTGDGMVALAAALAICVAAFGGALGQGMATKAALEGIARNPASQGKVFLPMVLGLALMESLVLFGFLIANTLAGRV